MYNKRSKYISLCVKYNNKKIWILFICKCMAGESGPEEDGKLLT